MLIELERIISNSWGGTKILVNYLSNKVLKHLAVAFNALEGFSLLIEMIYVYFFTDLCFDMSTKSMQTNFHQNLSVLSPAKQSNQVSKQHSQNTPKKNILAKH
jgi:hypothetical protein